MHNKRINFLIIGIFIFLLISCTTILLIRFLTKSQNLFMSSNFMNIAIRADGSKEKGLGHISRCFALAQAFLDCGDKVHFFCGEQMTGGIQWNGTIFLFIGFLTINVSDMAKTRVQKLSRFTVI